MCSLEEGELEITKEAAEGTRGSLGRRPLGHPLWPLGGREAPWRLRLGGLGRRLLELRTLGQRGRRGGELRQVRQRVDVNGVGSLLSLISHVNTLLAGDQVDQLVAVLADNHRSKRVLSAFPFVAATHLPVVTGNVVPTDSVVIFVVEDSQARLVMELLQPLDGDADVVLGVDGSVLDALKVVRLPLALPAKHQDRDDDTPRHTSHLLSSGAPEGLSGGGAVGRGDAGVAGSGPEPPVDDDGGEVRGVAALVLEVALPAAGVHRGDVI